MHEDELTRLVRIAKFAVHNSETQPLLAGYSSDFITDGITTIAMKQRREGETPEMAFSRVIVEDPDARVLMKARKLRPTPYVKAQKLLGGGKANAELESLRWDMAQSVGCFLEAAQMLGRPQDYSDVADQMTAIGEVLEAGAVLEASLHYACLRLECVPGIGTTAPWTGGGIALIRRSMGAHKIEIEGKEI